MCSSLDTGPIKKRSLAWKGLNLEPEDLSANKGLRGIKADDLLLLINLRQDILCTYICSERLLYLAEIYDVP